jgi:hypothetical protein
MQGEMYYKAAAAANVVVTAKPAVLKRIIIGASVGSSVVEVSDSKTDGDGNVKIYLAGDTLLGVYEIDAVFVNGITLDLTNQTQVTVGFENMGNG